MKLTRKLSFLVVLIVMSACSAGGDDGQPTSPPVAPTGNLEDAEAKDHPDEAPPTAAPSSTAIPTNFDKDGDGFYTGEEFLEATLSLIGYMQFPEQYPLQREWLIGMIQPAISQEPNTKWEVGYEYAMIQDFHECAWEAAYVDAYKIGDSEQQREAISQLRINFDRLGWIYDPDSLQYRIGTVDKAELGDPSLLLRDLELNCQGNVPPRVSSGTPTGQ